MGTLTDAIKKTEKYASEQKEACSAEAKLTVEWDKESDPEAAKAEREGRNAAKKQLADAIAKRQTVLKKFLDKLYAGRSDLDASIKRTNDIFFGVYDANVATQVVAKNAMHKTAGLAEADMKPFKPIILPSSKLEPLGGAARPSTSKAAAKAEEEGKVALMEMASQVQNNVASCTLEECKVAYNAGYELYDFVFKLDCANYKIFDVDTRRPLMTYRNGLHKLITDREAKLEALEKQRNALENGINNEQPKLSLAQLYGYIDKHKVIQKTACDIMPTNTAKILKELKSVLADARANKLLCSLEQGPGSSALGETEATEQPKSDEKPATTTAAPAETAVPEKKEVVDKAPSKAVEDTPTKDGTKSETDEVFDQPA